MGKKVWHYKGKNPQGFSMEGTINENTRQEAEATARRMGIINPTISDPTEPERPADPIPPQGKLMSVPTPPGMRQEVTPAEKRLGEMVAGMKSNVERHITDTKEPKLRQSLLIGDEPKITNSIEPLLAAGGRILSVNMQSNHNGIMIFAIVVEHVSVAEKETK